MGIKKRTTTRVQVETRELIVLRGEAPRTRAYCAQCRQQTWWMTASQACQLAGVSIRTVYRWVEAGEVHFEEGEGREIRVCSSSLPLKRNDESRRMS